MKLFPLFLCLVFGLLSCSDPDIDNEGTETLYTDFVFGWSFGECLGDCATLYKYKDDALFQDDVKGHMVQFKDVRFQDVTVDDATALAEVKSLIEDFPDYLIESTEVSFGCPDCGDWGAIHIMLEIDGEERWWTLDNMIDGNPKEIQAWTQRVQMLITELAN